MKKLIDISNTQINKIEKIIKERTTSHNGYYVELPKDITKFIKKAIDLQIETYETMIEIAKNLNKKEPKQ